MSNSYQSIYRLATWANFWNSAASRSRSSLSSTLSSKTSFSAKHVPSLQLSGRPRSTLPPTPTFPLSISTAAFNIIKDISSLSDCRSGHEGKYLSPAPKLLLSRQRQQQYSSNNSQKFHEKITQRLLDTEIGAFNQASVLELTTAISAWHSQAISNQYDTYAFYQANALLDRLLQEFMDSLELDGVSDTATDVDSDNTTSDAVNDDQGKNNDRRKSSVDIKVEVDTINLVLDSWRIINNTRWLQEKQNRKTLSDDEISFANHGMEILNKCCEIALKYQSLLSSAKKSKITLSNPSSISHPDAKSFNIVLDGYSKLGMIDEANAIFQKMQTLTHSKKQSQCRPGKISYNTLLYTYANSNTNQIENAQKASDILENMLHLYHQTQDPDVKPDAISFSIVISAYANASPFSEEAPYQAEQILKTMIDMYNSSLIENGGDGEWLDLKPNHMCYTSLISAWSKSGLSEAVDRSATILGTMQTVGERADSFNNEETIENSSETMNLNLDVDGEQAENLINKMLSLSESTGDQSMMPSTMTFTALLDCLAQSAGQKVGGDGGEAALRCENVLRKMEELYEAGNDTIRPNTSVYNALINAWAKSMRPDAGNKAEEWLEIMKTNHLSGYDAKPDKITFSSTILAYANVNNGKDAERIFMQMYEAYKSGEKDCKPNVVSLSAVINAYANEGKPVEAERLLSTMNELQCIDGLETDRYCLNCILKAYTNSGHKDSMKMALNFLKKMDAQGLSDSVTYASILEKLSKIGNRWAEEKGESLLERMWNLYEKGNSRIKPTTVVYNSLINLLAKSNNPKISRKSLDVLNDLQQRYDLTKDPDLMPDTVTFNATLSAFSKASNKSDVEKAESIVEQMEELYNQGYNGIKPDAFTLTSMISCYAHSSVEGSAERAEEILQQMQAMYDDHGDKSMRPTKASFGAVLNAWAREGNSLRAQAIVDHMETLQDTYEEMSANDVIYNTLINSWAKSGTAESGQKAEEILTKMQELYQNGNKEVKPSRITYNSVLSAHHKSGKKGAFINANNILQQMEDAKDRSISPDVVTYTTFLNIVSKWNNALKTDIAEQVLEKMMTRGIEPNNFTYDAILRTCLNVNSRDHQLKRKALVLAVKTLSTMQESPQIIPTSYTYSIFFSVISKHSAGNEQMKLLNRTLQDCCKAGLLTDSILGQLKRSFRSALIQHILFPRGNAREISLQNLPPEWSRHSEQKLPTTTSQRQAVRTQHHTGRKKVSRH